MFGFSGAKSRSGSWSLACGAGMLMSTIATSASAADSGFVNVSDINVANSGTVSANAGTASAGYFMYYAQPSVPACPSLNVSAEALRGYQSLLQAALLSGKTVKIVYDTCGSSTRYITGIQFHG